MSKVLALDGGLATACEGTEDGRDGWSTEKFFNKLVVQSSIYETLTDKQRAQHLLDETMLNISLHVDVVDCTPTTALLAILDLRLHITLQPELQMDHLGFMAQWLNLLPTDVDQVAHLLYRPDDSEEDDEDDGTVYAVMNTDDSSDDDVADHGSLSWCDTSDDGDLPMVVEKKGETVNADMQNGSFAPVEVEKKVAIIL